MRPSHLPVQSGCGMEVGLAWHVLSIGASTIVFHNGGTGGYRSVICFDPDRQVGVVLLTNSARDIDGIALALISTASASRRASTGPVKRVR